MIIRVMGLGQFEVKSSLYDDLNIIDNTIVEYVNSGDEKAFKISLEKLITLIVENGKRLPDEEIVQSDAVIPPADLTLCEAREIFTGEGIFSG
jgi:hypothetical protein